MSKREIRDLIEKAAGEFDHAHNELHRAFIGGALNPNPEELLKFVANAIDNLRVSQKLLIKAKRLLVNS